MISIQERANNKIYSNIQMQYIELQDLKRELKSNRFKGNITIDEMENLIESCKTELKVLNYIYKLIELNNDK